MAVGYSGYPPSCQKLYCHSWKAYCWAVGRAESVPGAKIGDGSIPESFSATQYFSINGWTIQSQRFGLWGEAVQCYKTINGAILKGRIAWNGQQPWLKQLLYGFSSHMFLGKALGVPVACSLCSPLFSTLL